MATRPRLAASLRRLDLRTNVSRDESEHAKLAVVLTAILRIARGVVAVMIGDIEEDAEWDEVADALGGCERLRALGYEASGSDGNYRSFDTIFRRQAPWSVLDRVLSMDFDLQGAPGAEHWSEGDGPLLTSLSVEASRLGDEFLLGFVASCSRLSALSITDCCLFGKPAFVSALNERKHTLRRLEFLGNNLDGDGCDDKDHLIDASDLVHLAVDADVLEERQWLSMRMSRVRSLFVDRPSAAWPIMAAAAFGSRWRALRILAFNRDVKGHRIDSAVCRVLKVRRPGVRHD